MSTASRARSRADRRGGAILATVRRVMNELLRDFLTEAHENLYVIDVEIVRF